MFLYSASENGFYITSVNGADVPKDVVEITEDQWQSLLEGQSSGKVLSGDSKGRPVLKSPPGPTNEQLAANAVAQRDALLALAGLRIAPLQDAVDLEDASNEDSALLKQWKQYRVALNRIQDQSGFPKKISWPVAPE